MSDILGAKRQIDNIRKNVIEQVEYNDKKIKEYIDEFKKEINDILKPTVALFDYSYSKTPQAKFSNKYTGKNRKHRMTIQVFDKSNRVHSIWHILNNGRKDTKPDFVVFPMYEYETQQTKPNSLFVSRFRPTPLLDEMGRQRYFFLNNRRAMVKRTLKGIKARNWYRLALDLFLSSPRYYEFKKFALNSGYEFNFMIKTNSGEDLIQYGG